MYDVIVIGAGPAGSTAANVLSEKDTRFYLWKSLRCHIINHVPAF